MRSPPSAQPTSAASRSRRRSNARGVAPDEVQHVIMGQVLMAGQGQVPSRQAAVKAGIPMSVPSVNVNKVCLSGLNTIYLANQMIAAGEADIVVAGGMESMTNAPYIADGARAGFRYGNTELADAIIKDGSVVRVRRLPDGPRHRPLHLRHDQPGRAGRAVGTVQRARRRGDQGRTPRRRDRPGRGATAPRRADPRRARRRCPPRHDRRESRQAAPRLRPGRHDHRRQRLAAVRRCQRRRR